MSKIESYESIVSESIDSSNNDYSYSECNIVVGDEDSESPIQSYPTRKCSLCNKLEYPESSVMKSEFWLCDDCMNKLCKLLLEDNTISLPNSNIDNTQGSTEVLEYYFELIQVLYNSKTISIENKMIQAWTILSYACHSKEITWHDQLRLYGEFSYKLFNL